MRERGEERVRGKKRGNEKIEEKGRGEERGERVRGNQSNRSVSLGR